jgi:hypothetical protein
VNDSVGVFQIVSLTLNCIVVCDTRTPVQGFVPKERLKKDLQTQDPFCICICTNRTVHI